MDLYIIIIWLLFVCLIIGYAIGDYVAQNQWRKTRHSYLYEWLVNIGIYAIVSAIILFIFSVYIY